MNNNKELISWIDKLIELIHQIYLPVAKVPQLMCINIDVNPITLMDSLIEFIYVDQNKVFSREIGYDDYSRMIVDPVRDKNEAEIWGEINDLLVDISDFIIEKYCEYIKNIHLHDLDSHEVELVIEKLKRYKRTRSHNLYGIFTKIQEDIERSIYYINIEESTYRSTYEKRPKIKANILAHIDSHLKDLFELDSQYEYIMNLLFTKGYCDRLTYIWSEREGTKGLCIAIIKDLRIKGYYKDNFRKRLSPELIQRIIENTFGINVSQNTIKHTDIKNHNVSFIPYSIEARR